MFVALGNNVTLSGGGAGSTAVLDGVGDKAYVSGDAIFAGAGSSATVSGAGNVVQLGDYVTATVSGGSYVTSTGLDDNTTLGGNGNYLVQSSGLVTISGGADATNLSNTYVTLDAGSTLVAYGSSNTVIANGAGDTTGLYGNGNTLSQTGGTVSLTGAGDTGYLMNTHLDLGNYTGVAVGGTGNVVSAGQGDSTQLYGDANQITQSGGLVILGGSNETAVVSGAQFGLSADTQANLSGSNNYVYAASGDDLTANGGNNTIYGGGDQRITVGGTNDTLDTIVVSNDDNNVAAADGQSAGIYVSAGAQADVQGSSDAISTTVGDTLDVNGGGNAITGGGDERIVIGQTYGNSDNVAVSNDDNNVSASDGQAAGIYINSNSQADLNGVADAVGLNDNVTANLIAYDDQVTAGKNDSLTLTGGGDDVNQYSGNLTLQGTGATAADYGVVDGTGLTLGDYAVTNLSANDDTVNAGAGDIITLTGGGNDLNQYSGSLTLQGTGGVADYGTVDYSTLKLGDYATANLTANHDGINAGSNDGVTLSGSGNVVAIGNNTGLTVDAGTANNITAGGYDDTSIYGSGNTLTQTTGTANFASTDNTADVSYANIYESGNSSLTVNGTNDTIQTNAGDSLGAYGGNNTINGGGAENIVIGGTNGVFDKINVSNDDNNTFAVNGNLTGIYLDGNSQANVNGSDDAVSTQVGDSLGAYGNGNSIMGGGDQTIVVNGMNDNVSISYDDNNVQAANGQVAGIYLDPNSEANVNGSYDAIDLKGNDTLGAYNGGGNRITSEAQNNNVGIANTNGITDTVINDVATGPGIGVTIDPNSQVNVSGFGNSITASSGDTTNVSGNNDTFNATGGNDTTNVTGNYDTITATGGVESIAGTGDVGYINGSSDIIIGDATSTNIVGSIDTIGFGRSDDVGIKGSNEKIFEGVGDRTSSIGNYNVFYGSANATAGDTLGIAGTGEVLQGVDSSTISLGGSTSVSGTGDNYDRINAVSGDTSSIANSYDDDVYGNNLNGFEISGGSGNRLFGSGDASDQENGFDVEGGSYDGYVDPGDGTDDDEPIILNLNGQKVQTQSSDTSTAFFDIRSDGQPVQTGWLTAGEGMLIYNPSGGPITQANQLVPGFGALSQLAQTTETTLDASNPLFDKLQVWVDPTGDAQFNPQDLYSLQDLGITSISLAPQTESVASNGNVIVADSTFTWNGGASGDIAGVDLFYNPSSFADTISPPPPSSAPDALTAAVNDLSATQAGASFSLLGDTHGTANTAFDPSSLTAVTTTPANTLLPVSHAA